ncbi:MAG: hypothetical protein ACI4KG_06320 [Oscillospiraceae bacterium]
MNIRKFIYFITCIAVTSCIFTGCNQNKNEIESEVTAVQTAETTAETKASKEIPLASVNTSYKAVTIDGNTTNMDEGTVWRGLGVVTGNNSSRLLMDYKTENPDAWLFP